MDVLYGTYISNKLISTKLCGDAVSLFSTTGWPAARYLPRASSPVSIFIIIANTII